MNTEYLSDDGYHLEQLEAINAFVTKYFIDNPGYEEVKLQVMENIKDIVGVSPNLKQLEAFLCDICGIYSQARSRIDPTTSLPYKYQNEESDSMIEEEAEDEEEAVRQKVATPFDRNVENLTAMGFVKEE